jgi:hypothetical protein
MQMFSKHGIRAIPFKGPTLALYYQQECLREFDDLDILVTPADFNSALGILLNRGYGISSDLTKSLSPDDTELVLYNPRNGITIELHRALNKPSKFIQMEELGIWERMKPSFLAGRRVWTMSEEDMVLLLCIHGSKHSRRARAWTGTLCSIGRPGWAAFARSLSRSSYVWFYLGCRRRLRSQAPCSDSSSTDRS